MLYASSSSSSASSTSTNKSTLDMTDYLKLLAAQFENQDITNPTDSTEFISELAQFSSLAAMNTLTQYSNRQYASSLIGKTVSFTGTNSSGSTVSFNGEVIGSKFSGDTTTLSIYSNGELKDCDISEITAVTEGSSSSNTLSLLTEMAEYSDYRYASSLIGKTVEVQSKDSDGNTSKSTGVVESASFSDGSISLTVNCDGTEGSYDISDVTKVIGTSGTASSGTSSGT